jgi:putative ABC transport system permease protein
MFRRKRETADFQAEIEAHLELEIERLLEQGLPEHEAREAALRSFGNVSRTQERFREASSWDWWDGFYRDIRFGLRMLRRNLGLTIVVIVTMALGIGASTVVFSIADRVLHREPEWYRHGSVMGLEPERNVRSFRFSIPEYVQLSALDDIFESAAALYWSNAILTTGDYPERLGCAHVTANDLLRGNPPELGRFFSVAEDRPGGPLLAVLSDEFWRKEFAGDPEILGRRIMLDGSHYTVVGITPPDEHRFGSDVMVPAQLDLADTNLSRRNLWVLVILRPGVTWEQADARLNAVAWNMAQEYRVAHPEYTGLQLHFWNGFRANTGGIRTVVLLLLAAVGVLLLIACANIATLLLVRSSTRMQEFTLRTTLGARRGRLIRQLLTENVMLAVAGGLAGIAVARLCLPFIVHLIPATVLNVRPDQIHLNMRVLGGAVGLTLLAGVVFGLFPAARYSGPWTVAALKQCGSQIAGDRAGRLVRHVLVVAELALTLLVLVSAALMVESYHNLEHIDLGFHPENVLSMQITLPETTYPAPEKIGRFFQEAIERVRAVPGVDGTAVVSGLPMLDRTVDLTTQDFTIEGHPVQTGNGLANANFRIISSGYFDVVRARLIRGRIFNEQDEAGPGKAPVAVINETMARLYWPGSDPVGARIHFASRAGDTAGAESAITIIGVVADIKQIRVIDAPVREEFYLPVPQFAERARGMTMMVHSSIDSRSLTSSIRQAIKSIDAEVPIYDVATMTTVVSDSFGPKRIATVLLGFFALVALVLSTLGVYAVIAYSAAQRSREIGLRLALGAQRKSILKLMMRSGIVLAVAGLGSGTALSVLLTRFMLHVQYGSTPVGLFYGVSSHVPGTFMAIVVLLLLVAVAACYVPARRAMDVDPIVTLRYD